MPGLTLGDTIPNLEVETTQGKFKLHDYIDGSYVIIFSHPGDFTPVCTTELATMAAYAEKFKERGVKLLGFSCDDVSSHKEWIKDIEAYDHRGQGQHKVTFPIAADPSGDFITQLNLADPDEMGNSGKPVPSRALHVVGPDRKIKLSFLYPGCTGRNMDEVVRVLDSLHKANKYKVATPANWKPGEQVVVAPSVSTEQAKQMFPQGIDIANLPSGKDYLRFTNV